MSVAPQYDVAIVGGGVSGVYSGWRLLNADLDASPLLKKWAGSSGKLKVAVFEGSERIGGRLLSARPPGMPHVTCEIGGMRYVSTQKLIKSLVQKALKLKSIEQVVYEPNNLAFLRGISLRQSQLDDPDVLPYNLSQAETEYLQQPNNTSSALIGWAISQILPGVQNLHGAELQEFLKNAKVGCTPLYQHGFWNLLARAITSEAYQLARATIGYDALAVNANAVDLTSEYFDFTPDVKYYLIDGGYDLVPWTLEKQFREARGDVVTGSWLSSFDAATLDDGSTGVVLHFHNGPSITARSILLAMPRRSIELLRPVGPVLDPSRAPHVQYLLNSVQPVPLYKLMIAYDNPWWEAFGVSQGRSLTDIPLRQCYYWAVEGEQPSANKKNRNSLIMAYNDETSVDFWGGLRHLPLDQKPDALKASWLAARHEPPPDHGPKARVFDRKTIPHADSNEAIDSYAARLRKNWDDHKAPNEMVMEMHRQLIRMHSAQYAPEPLDAAYMDWSDDPYGGGVHFWNSGYQSWKVLKDMTQPVPDFPCYVCGEAYSTNQTWVEGALQTAEIVLQERLGLPKPGWLIDE